MRVNEVMTTPVQTIGAERSANEAWEAMRLHRTRHLVVTASDGHVVGVLSASDLGGKYGQTFRSTRQVAELMTEKVVVATPETTVREAANLMRGHSINCLPVFVGRRLKGIVTALDLLELIGRGAERPLAKSVRRIMKDRGQSPAVERAAKRLASRRRTVVR
jgi:acetoin utilization protein AcuB